VLSPSVGLSVPQALGDVEIDELTTARSPPGLVTLTLPAGLTFASTPSGVHEASNGLQVGPGLLSSSTVFWFPVTQAIRQRSGKVIVTGIGPCRPSAGVTKGRAG